MLEGYITPLLTSYLSRYIKNIKPSDLRLSFWGGDAVLRNLELKLDAIEESLRGLVPFDLKSGCVKQLTIHIPWTSIGSEPIEVTLDSVECTLKLHNLQQQQAPSSGATKGKTTPPESLPDQAPGYVSGLLSRIINNIILKVSNLILKIVEENSDVLFSISVKELEWFMSDSSWKRQFIYTDNLQNEYALYKVCLVTGATMCLDVISGSGQVEMHDEPFLPHCHFECRWRASYRGNAMYMYENRFEVLVREAEFSVSEQQFSLFLHFLDWLLATYYSMKKLKGHDGKEVTPSSTEHHSTTTGIPKEEEHLTSQATPTQTTPSQSSDEDGWGSWLMSLVTTDEDMPQIKPTMPTQLPSLSLGFYVELLTIDFRVTSKKPHPVFFSNIRRGSWSVMRFKCHGCCARVNRIPTLKHLDVSVGIMAINGWIGGVCPCNLVTMATRKHHRTSTDETLVSKSCT